MADRQDKAGQPRWGAVRQDDGRWQVNIWAPTAERLDLVVGDRTLPMDGPTEGWHGAELTAPPGTPYRFVRDGTAYPDPASRRQGGDVNAASLLTDLPAASDWPGRPWPEAVLYELHVGTFTEEGTLRAAADRLKDLTDLGITCVSLMPLAQFAGHRGWGYDGVLPYALHPAYGTPEDLAAFIDEAHRLGAMVLIDAVYNHFGPEGNVLSQLCPGFFDAGRHTPWGAAIAMEEPAVRAFFLQNAEMWVRDYGADGLRLDAVHQIGTPGSTDFLTELSARMEALDLSRPVHLVAEDERNLVSYTGTGTLRAQWNDDWHHAVHCLTTGESQSYYAPFAVDPFDDLVTALRDGQVDQGQERPGGEARGETSHGVHPVRFVNANQTHDQVGNRAMGDRLISLVGAETAMVLHAALLLSPFVPMLFMGEEAGSRAPFRFFTDFDGDLAQIVRDGRRSEFPEFADHKDDIPDPNDPATFAASRPDGGLEGDAGAWRDLTRELLTLRRTRIVPLLAGGYGGAEVTRAGETAVAVWRFDGGRLAMCLAAAGDAPALPGGFEEIHARAVPGGLSMRAGIGGQA
ncbi:malto-oligosyltrehalose trehalohydrolase [Wenxinia saemankumensis]|uniref:Malto-oligosyltrehalose trehalohydrolase n=1 Tax=Wenxinia saemankumensis TaxID=1447782 RepID=A0A1M6EWC2_9RHOB|nr:malto-oligosyltrehalose trehalohydrolase [Wenxinia saemankumensis]SHI89661.1 maltooligosyl trehalose hydrolase [Wenxinia saemankumensis]